MPQMIRGVWPEGWKPSQNEFNGSQQALLRSDNLRPDETGVLSLVQGTKQVSSGALADQGNFIFSSVMDLNRFFGSPYPSNARVRYVGLSNGVLARNYDPTNKTLTDFGLQVFSGGSGIYAGANCFGHNLLFSGSQKWKDRGDEQWPLGIPAPLAITASANTPPFVFADDRDGSGNFVRWDTAAVEGVPLSYNKSADYVQVTAAAVAGTSLFRSIVQRGILTTSTLTLNTLNTGAGTDEDLFRFAIRLSNTDSFIKVRLEYLLETPTTASLTQDVENYYWHEWTNRVSQVISTDLDAPDLIPWEISQEDLANLQNGAVGVTFVPSIRSGVNVWSTLQCKRGSFNRVGDNDALDWNNVKGIRVLVFATDAQTSVVNDFQFIGGTRGTLTGQFSYIQVDCRDTNTYIETSLPGAASADLTTFGSSNLITPVAPNPQANFVNIYRASDKTDGYYLVKQLPKIFITGISNAGAAVCTSLTHGLSTGNVVAIRGGLGLWDGVNGNHTVTVTGPNTFTVPVNSTGFGTFGPTSGTVTFCNYSPFNDFFSDTEAVSQGTDARLAFNYALPPDNIISVIAPYFTRAIYADTKAIYISAPNNPGLIDADYTIEIASEDSEQILFATKIAERVIYVATTKDIYILAGDGTIDATGVINFQLASLGIDQTPISAAHAVEDGTLYYLASDGWRFLAGSNSRLVSRDLDLMFQGITCHGLNPFRILPRNENTNSAIITRGKLYASMEQDTLGRCLVIYDFARQAWRYQRQSTAANNPLHLWLEEDGTILYTTESTGDKFLHQLDVGTLIDETIKWDVTFRTIYDADSRPKNRKDVFTLSLDMDSGNDVVTIVVRAITDNATPVVFSTTQAFNGRSQFSYDIYSTIGITKFFQVELTCAGASKFTIYNFSIDYELRPTQLTNLRLTPTNYGVQGRKRIPEIPLVIDTLGNSVTFTPLLDGVLQPPATISTTDKATYNYQFLLDSRAVDIGGLLSCPSGVFEFYELVTPREVEVLPDSLKFKRISATNLGTSSRKRISQFAFVIDTKGNNVSFTPQVDGVNFPLAVYNTTRKQTVIYTFVTEALGIDIEGTLVASAGDFEYYGPDYGDCVYEKLPSLARFLRLNTTNWGSAARKRIRTIPLVIDTKGQNVVFTPTVDGVEYPSATFNTTEKRTVLYYFESDAFGIDVGGTLSGAGFEFYGMLTPEIVEILPVAKRFDQLGPIEFKKLGKLFAFRLRLIPLGTSISYNLYMQDGLVANGTIVVTPNVQAMYEVRFPKFIMGQVCRIELQSNVEFHRLYGEYQVALSGAETSMKWVKMQ